MWLEYSFSQRNKATKRARDVGDVVGKNFKKRVKQYMRSSYNRGVKNPLPAMNFMHPTVTINSSKTCGLAYILHGIRISICHYTKLNILKLMY